MASTRDSRALAHQRISDADLDRLQENLILSHAVGVGDEVPEEIHPG